jgi:MerR family transcriptional regulator, thiopeptide resistance regulator
MAYTVKQLANLAGVSSRTLHYYDEIGMLKPAAYGEKGYRYYGEEAVLKLQQILFFRELDFSLEEIKEILSQPEFDRLQALEAHKQALQHRMKRLDHLVHTIDRTILYLKGKEEMKQKDLFEGFSEEKQKEYAEEIRRKYGKDATNESDKNWASYSEDKKAAIMAESQMIYRDLAQAMDSKESPQSPAVQLIVERWHQHLKYFYEPSIERLKGLGQMYTEDPRFSATFNKIHAGMPEYLNEAIQFYCQGKG